MNPDGPSGFSRFNRYNATMNKPVSNSINNNAIIRNHPPNNSPKAAENRQGNQQPQNKIGNKGPGAQQRPLLLEKRPATQFNSNLPHYNPPETQNYNYQQQNNQNSNQPPQSNLIPSHSNTYSHQPPNHTPSNVHPSNTNNYSPPQNSHQTLQASIQANLPLPHPHPTTNIPQQNYNQSTNQHQNPIHKSNPQSAIDFNSNASIPNQQQQNHINARVPAARILQSQTGYPHSSTQQQQLNNIISPSPILVAEKSDISKPSEDYSSYRTETMSSPIEFPTENIGLGISAQDPSMIDNLYPDEPEPPKDSDTELVSQLISLNNTPPNPNNMDTIDEPPPTGIIQTEEYKTSHLENENKILKQGISSLQKQVASISKKEHSATEQLEQMKYKCAFLEKDKDEEEQAKKVAAAPDPTPVTTTTSSANNTSSRISGKKRKTATIALNGLKLKLGKSTQNKSLSHFITTPVVKEVEKTPVNVPVKRRKFSDNSNRSRKNEPSGNLSDSQEDLKKEETLTLENERLRNLVKKYRVRIDHAKKALISDEYETETERKLSEMKLLLETLSNQLKSNSHQNTQPIEDPNIIKSTKEEYDKTQKELATLSTEINQLNSTLSTERKQLYGLKEENQYLKNRVDTLQCQASVWPDEKAQYLDRQKNLEKELARERQEKDFALKNLESKLQTEWKEKQRIWQQQSTDSEKLWKIKESKFDEKQAQWESLEKIYKEDMEKLKLEHEVSDINLKAQFEEEKRILEEGHKIKINKYEKMLKNHYQSMYTEKVIRGGANYNPNPTLYTPQ